MTHSPPISDRRPRIALLGEFSAGKSTLANALLGQKTSPVRVTATQVPPFWYLAGSGAPVRVDRENAEHPLDGTDLAEIPVGDTRVVRVPLAAQFLDRFDLIDMPGSSDPNMDPDIWDALLPEADLAIWCTPATQAWRQTEAAIWEELPDLMRSRSLLLLTRMDKVQSSEDRRRLLQRVARETEGAFHEVLPVNLLQALGAPAGTDPWRKSGLAKVEAELMRIHAALTDPAAEPLGAAAKPRAGEPQQPKVATPKVDAGVSVLPRRVTARSGGSARRARAVGDGSIL